MPLSVEDNTAAKEKLNVMSDSVIAAARDSINLKAGCDQWSTLTASAKLTICALAESPSRKKKKRSRKKKSNAPPVQSPASPELKPVVAGTEAAAPAAEKEAAPAAGAPAAGRVGKLASMFGGNSGKFNEGELFECTCGACGVVLCNGDHLRRMDNNQIVVLNCKSNPVRCRPDYCAKPNPVQGMLVMGALLCAQPACSAAQHIVVSW